MSNHKARLAMVLRVAREQGYSVPPRVVLIRGVWYSTRTGNAVGR